MGASLDPLIEAGLNLSTLAVKGTVTAVATKLKALRAEKNVEVLRNTYEELINELLAEREEAIRIAQVYKSELERIEISDKDIEHLHNTAAHLLEFFKAMNPDAPIEQLVPLQRLISVDTLKAMQLLGFNFKAAIGEPLTELCADFIRRASKSNQNPLGRSRPINNRK
ncbi:hypothetical protein [Alicyclobacillus macrosporangiidus]|uniref:hypothetical protein n=1 Tax=Alicyclobacillus macrosporangiidus TaxID=392015 RepID=UPI00069019BB|nr:hypothetical protein [Alicyclobacillus macrosporangiidus]